MEQEIDRLHLLSPEQRWQAAFVAASALADLMDGIPGLADKWALDGDAALVGHGLPLQPLDMTVSVIEGEATLGAAETARRQWPGLEVRARSPLPTPVAMTAEGRVVPVLPLEHVAPDGPDGVAALAAWAGRLSASSKVAATWHDTAGGT